MAVAPTSTYNAALPYAMGTLAVGAVGATVACTASSVAVVVSAVALALIGAIGFYGVIACGLAYRNDPEGFQENIHMFLWAAAGSAIAEIIQIVAREVLVGLIRGRGQS